MITEGNHPPTVKARTRADKQSSSSRRGELKIGGREQERGEERRGENHLSRLHVHVHARTRSRHRRRRRPPPELPPQSPLAPTAKNPTPPPLPRGADGRIWTTRTDRREPPQPPPPRGVIPDAQGRGSAAPRDVDDDDLETRWWWWWWWWFGAEAEAETGRL